MTTAKRVGELNGLWSFLMRLLLGTYPFLLIWATWVSREQVLDTDARNKGDRWTMQQGEESRRRIEALESSFKTVDDSFHEITARLTRIEAILAAGGGEQ